MVSCKSLFCAHAPVFYSTPEKTWKIGRSYEEVGGFLNSDNPVNSISKADNMNSLGQLICQLAALQSEPGDETPFLPPWLPEFIEVHLRGIIDQLTRNEGSQPPASAVSRIFESYCQLLSLELVPLLFNLQLFPSFEEWTDYPCISPFNILMRLAEFYQKKKEFRIAALFRWELFIWDRVMDFEMTSMLSSNFDIQRWHYFLSFDSDEGIEKVKKEIESDPSNPAPPLALMDHYASKGRFSDAINMCKLHVVPQDAEKSLPLSEKSETFYSYPDRIGTLKSVASRFHKNDYPGNTTLSYAAWTGNTDVVKDLLHRNQVDWDTNQPTPLFLAAWNMHTDVAEVIAQNRNDWIETPDALGFSPLHIAVQNNDCRLITTLIEAGAPIEATTDEGGTPLLIAADMGHIEAAEILLNKGAQLVHKDKEGWQAVHWAAQCGQLEMIEYLCSKVLASTSSDEIKANDGTTPMHCAAEVGHVHVVKSLIKNGFELAPRNKARQTPEMLARKNGYKTVVQTLIEAGDNENNANGSATNSRRNKRRKITPNFRT